jgi:hypothetical protein
MIALVVVACSEVFSWGAQKDMNIMVPDGFGFSCFLVVFTPQAINDSINFDLVTQNIVSKVKNSSQAPIHQVTHCKSSIRLNSSKFRPASALRFSSS